MRFTVDTNILAYTIDPGDPRSVKARQLMAAALMADCFLTNQALGELINVTRRKKFAALAEARQAVVDWRVLLPVVATTTEHLVRASLLVEQNRLQFWDAVILTVSSDAEAQYLVSEDMQDGAIFAGVRIVNSFNPDNAELLKLLLDSAHGRK